MSDADLNRLAVQARNAAGVPLIAAAMLDRLLHRSVVFTITGDSYRLRAYQAQARKQRRKGAAN